MTHQFAEGDLVRAKTENKVGILSDINPNKNYQADDEVWAELTDPVEEFRTVGWVDSPDDLELVTKAADLPEKRLPTMEELRNYVSDALHGGWTGDIRTIETGPDGEDAVEFFAQMGNQRFGARIKIESIDWAD